MRIRFTSLTLAVWYVEKKCYALKKVTLEQLAAQRRANVRLELTGFHTASSSSARDLWNEELFVIFVELTKDIDPGKSRNRWGGEGNTNKSFSTWSPVSMRTIVSQLRNIRELSKPFLIRNCVISS